MSRLLFYTLTALLFFLPDLSYATAPDFSTLTGAVDFSTVATSVLSVAAGIVGVMVLIKGAGFIYSAMRGR